VIVDGRSHEISSVSSTNNISLVHDRGVSSNFDHVRKFGLVV
jgi:hypothetical protein